MNYKITTIGISLILLTILLVTPILAESNLSQRRTENVNQKNEQASGEAESLRVRIQERIESLKGTPLEQRSEYLKNVEERTAEARKTREERKATLTKKLEEFKNQKKAKLTEKLNETLTRINEKQTSQMAKYLDKTSEILDRLAERVENTAKNGKDTTALHTAIQKAKNAITEAKAAVEAQAAKDYSLNISSESSIRTDVKSTRNSLFKDLKAVRQKVIEAKQEVANAIRVAATTKDPSTSSGQGESEND
ncbi:MAG: hypothetical protein HYU80_01060 [Candidatus Blackburnbacteria bacterium]|nr:hypothetical protein [Candidatus Blackburnbacteria bacterium]